MKVELDLTAEECRLIAQVATTPYNLLTDEDYGTYIRAIEKVGEAGNERA